MEQHNRISSSLLSSQEIFGSSEKNYYLFSVIGPDGVQTIMNDNRLRQTIQWARMGHDDVVDIDLVLREVHKNTFDGISTMELADALVLAAISFIELDPVYGYVAARLLLKKLFKQVTNRSITYSDNRLLYAHAFTRTIEFGVECGLLDPRMQEYDLEFLSRHLVVERDSLFDYMGMRTLYDRYFLKHEHTRLELPQIFWMRIAMGLAYYESDKNASAVTFYNVMSQMNYVPGTPTLLHSGFTRPQLSSCFLSTVQDDLIDIFKSYSDSAQLAKWSGGVAVDWSNIRACGSMVKSIHTESQGLIPFLKINSDTVAAINRSGKRRGAAVVYLETWHLEIEDFLDLRKNTGDERRRTHDINTANWIPDLFMKRVIEDGEWTLFSPHEVSDLHHLYGQAFEKRYTEYEELMRLGEIEMFKVISAKQLWRKMLSKLFETGHPWITFKDSCNVRSPQDHIGVVHSSNLCTEITLNTSIDEVAVCNLGSVNLAAHIVDGRIDDEKLRTTVTTAIRMLDNVIDINYYPIPETKNSNMRHRPIGLGIMGFQNALYSLNINFSSKRALEFADEIMEKISFHAICASANLAQERGSYQSYKGSKWDRNIFPQDTIELLEKERGIAIEVGRGSTLDWAPARELVQRYGMRNSNTMAIAPTATIANIAGVFPSIEPIYKNMYVKANMSGEFTVVNKYLIDDLKTLGLWGQETLELIKYYDGNIQMIDKIPQNIKDKYQEVFEIDQLHLLHISAARGRWIDQAIAHNVFMKGVSGKLLNDIYMTAWKIGLKTTYYLRTLGATQIEKSTLDAKEFGFTQKRLYKVTNDSKEEVSAVALGDNQVDLESDIFNGQACVISEDPDCEVCQ